MRRLVVDGFRGGCSFPNGDANAVVRSLSVAWRIQKKCGVVVAYIGAHRWADRRGTLGHIFRGSGGRVVVTWLVQKMCLLAIGKRPAQGE